jgi:NADH-quinone oxidoreductase subunit G
MDAIANPSKTTLIQIAPSVRTAWGEPLGLSREQASVRRLVAALRKVGFDYIFDTDFTADLTITEEASEFVERLTHASDYQWPMFTSCCPGWMRWAKGHHPELINNISTAKSPQGMFGAIAKTWFAQSIGKSPQEVYSVSAMPCLAKKAEAAQENLNSTGTGPDVDCVLTVREITRLIRTMNIDVAALPEEDFDKPFGIGTGAGEIFGATGGVMEAALRTGYYYVTGENPDPDAFASVRGLDGWKEATFELPQATLRVAVVSGLSNAEKLIEAIQSGKTEVDFVEVMACPGGCVCGGGQPISESAAMAAVRGGVLYGLDKKNSYRFSHENPAVLDLYENFLGKPLSEKSHHLLHANHNKWQMPGECGND